MKSSDAVKLLLEQIAKEFPRLPVPECEVQFHPTRKWRFDIAWREARYAVEVDGGIWLKAGAHNTGKAMTRDREKDGEALILHWTVFRCTPDQVKSGWALDVILRTYDNAFLNNVDYDEDG